MQKEFTFAERIRQDLLLLTVNDEFLAGIYRGRSSESWNPPRTVESTEDGLRKA